MKDPRLEELHRTRERLLEESGVALTSLVGRLERDQVKSGRELYVIQDEQSITLSSPISRSLIMALRRRLDERTRD